ncbi:MAG: NAD(P)H-hydrate dehydratase [bacterium]
MILSAAQMLEAENEAFAAGATAEGLMEIAGREAARIVCQFHPQPGTCLVFFGKGHNGGDALVAARHLAAHGWSIKLQKTFPDSALSPLAAKQLGRIWKTRSDAVGPLIILDGLLGIGVSGEPREPVASAIQHINALRSTGAAWVLALDLPSGLGSKVSVQADATAAMGFVKTELVADVATQFVGRLAVIPLPGVHAPADADAASILQSTNLRSLLPPRGFDTHKGQCGRVAIIAGSLKYPGAARLSTAAAVKAGAGLVTLFVPPDVAPALSAAVIPEVMVSPVLDLCEILDQKFDAIAIGPGLGRERDDMVRDFLSRCTTPCVIDADALNAISQDPSFLQNQPAPRLLTPHPLEMERLFPRKSRTRRAWLEAFVAEYPVTLLLKGARTVIGERGSASAYNSTGHPGMASGGMGDTLSGVAAALIAQGKTPLQSAKLSAWLCGHAAELALRDTPASQESLTASDVISYLGPAFNGLRSGVP